MSDPLVDRPVGPDAIFISYRRGDTAYPASWLYQQLVARFGADHVFKDVDSIELGSDFVAEITTAVSACHCLLALIGRDWLTSVDGRGRRRLDDPADFVRIEIEAALARDVRVIPVLVEDAIMPYADELPPTLAPMTRRQALVLSPTRFTADIAKLVGVLERTFAEAGAARETEHAAARAEVERERLAADEADRAREQSRIAARQAALRERQAATESTKEAANEPARAAARENAGPERQPGHEAVRDAADPVIPRQREPATRQPNRAQPAGPHEADHEAADPVTPKQPEPSSREPDNPDQPAGPPPDDARDDSADRARRRSRRSTLWARGIVGSAVLFLVALFVPWTVGLFGLSDGFTRDGFSSETVVLAWILLLAAAAWVLLPGLGVSIRTPLRPQVITVGLTGLALVATVVGFVQTRSGEVIGTGGFGLARGSDLTTLAGAYVGLAFALVATVLAVLLLLAGRKQPAAPTPSAVAPRARRRYAAALAPLLALGVVGVTTHPLSTDDTPAPYDGAHSWWSSYGNNADTTLDTTNPIDLAGATSAGLTAEVNFYLEEGYDYLYGEVSIDDGASWTSANGTVDGQPIWVEGDDTEALDGKSGDANEDGETDWVPLTYDLSPWTGDSQVWFRFRYATDSSYVSEGVFLDNVEITADSTEVLRDGAENPDDGLWIAHGFVRTS